MARTKDQSVDYYRYRCSGDHMTLGRFIKIVKSGFITDDDGYGYYATSSTVSCRPAIPSIIARGHISRKFTHVMWFNK